MILEKIAVGSHIEGIEPEQTVTVIAVIPIREQMLFRGDESRLSMAPSRRPWSFDDSPESFRIATEATRINLAYLFDSMMAVHTSTVDPLPHPLLRLLFDTNLLLC